MPAGWVSAGAAVVGAGESIMSNQASASATAKNNAANANLTSAQNTMLNDAQTIANTPFTPYTGEMAAPMSGNEQQGVTMASNVANAGVAQADNTKATQQIDAVAANPWNASTAATYMNPYTQQVTDNAIANQNKSYLTSLAGLKEGTAGSDAFGGGRNAIAESNLSATNAQNIGTLTAQSNDTAYNTAFNQWQNDNTMKLNTANAYNASGQDVTNMNSAQISDLMKTGGVAQAISQTADAAQYNEFLRQQGWSANQLGSLIGAVGSDKGSPAQTAPIQSNVANQLMGAGSTIAGLFGGGSTSTNAFAGTTLANNNAAYNNYNQNNAPTASDISGSTAGAGDINVGSIDTGSVPDMPPIGD